MPAALEFHSVTKEYRGFPRRNRFRALSGFSLEVKQGEIFGFLGPNGAGKSTAIHLALGLMSATSGKGTMLGAPFGDAHTRRRVGFLAENVSLYSRPAERLLRFYGELNHVRDPQLIARVKDLLEQMSLSEVATKPVSKFSRGMLQRVGLAQALVNDPELLILDEPTSALDPAGRVMVREILLAERRKGKTIFLSSHLLSEIELICDRIAILHNGRLERVGSRAELLESQDECEIVATRLPAGMQTSAAATDGGVRVRVKRQEQREAIEKIWAAGGEVLRVNPARKTLEEIFLAATSEPKETGGQQ